MIGKHQGEVLHLEHEFAALHLRYNLNQRAESGRLTFLRIDTERKMKYKSITKVIVILLTISATLPVFAGTPRILLLGDSWAWFMFLNKSLDHALDARGMEEWDSVGMRTAIPGSTSSEWTQQDWLENVTKELERYPTVDIVHLSLGGNDYLRRWNNEMPIEARDKLFNGVVDDIRVVIKHILSVRPDMKIVIVGYDYVNASRRNSTMQQLNQAGQILERMKGELCKEFPNNVFHIVNYGLMQYHFGAEPDLKPNSVPLPGQAPEYDPYPGGNVNYGNAPAAMSDNIHLSIEGYKVLGEHCVDVMYTKLLEEGNTTALAAASEKEEK
jgi:lysophospholipase L1-like esterase